MEAALKANYSRYAPHFGGYNAAVRIGSEYARRARLELDIDEPSIEALQTLMLLAQASYQLGRGKKTFMLLSTIQSIPEVDLKADTMSRRCNKHDICSRSTSRTATRHEGHTRGTRRPPTTLLVMLPYGSIRSHWLQTPLPRIRRIDRTSPTKLAAASRRNAARRRLLPQRTELAIHGRLW